MAAASTNGRALFAPMRCCMRATRPRRRSPTPARRSRPTRTRSRASPRSRTTLASEKTSASSNINGLGEVRQISFQETGADTGGADALGIAAGVDKREARPRFPTPDQTMLLRPFEMPTFQVQLWPDGKWDQKDYVKVDAATEKEA